ncbi:MAG: Txe/YoeB family addiction module toxin [Cytophagaceae bacterium]|nr:Txe/YoeB family addiction module toxin [Cytophagaceae bacterium]
MRAIQFDPDAFRDYLEWSRADKSVFTKINELLLEAARTPFHGKGKPEPLKRNWAGYWSRRITDEHRLIYKVDDEKITVASVHGHYN